jgi:hypothetical protein
MEENDKQLLEKYQEYWKTVDKALNEGTMSGYKIAIIETEKILSMALDDEKFPGKDISEQIKNAEIVFRNKEKLDYSRAMYNKIVKEPGFDISSEDTKEIVTGYYQAISDIVRMGPENIGLKEKVSLLLQRYFYQFSQKTRKIAILLFLFFLSVFIITETPTGHSISELVINLTRFLFYKVLPVILTIAAIGIAVIGLLYYWQSRKR